MTVSQNYIFLNVFPNFSTAIQRPEIGKTFVKDVSRTNVIYLLLKATGQWTIHALVNVTVKLHKASFNCHHKPLL